MFIYGKTTFVFGSFLLVSISIALLDAQECVDRFDVTSGSVTPYNVTDVLGGETAIFSDVSELQRLALLYSVSVIGNLSKDPEGDGSNSDAEEFMSFTYNGSSNIMDVILTASLQNQMDYDHPNPKVLLIAIFYFDFTDGTNCPLQLQHTLIDANSAIPHFELESYTVHLREDWPAELPILGFFDVSPLAVDFDASLPNNNFTVTTANDCPLEVVGDGEFYTPEGQWTSVVFQLKKGIALDYDTMEEPYEITCIATLKDHGNPSMNSSDEIVIAVAPFDDEEPVFLQTFYTGYLLSLTEGAEVYVDPVIEAQDMDTPPKPLTYSMTDTDAGIGGMQYFSINETTGVVSVSQDIDNSTFLSNSPIRFTLEASDEYDTASPAFLTVILSTNGVVFAFERDVYTAQALTPDEGDFILRIFATGASDVVYTFDEDNSEGVGNFTLDENSGYITMAVSNAPIGQYWLTALADATGQAQISTMVNIVIEGVIDVSLPFVSAAVFQGSVPENAEAGPTGVTVVSEGATFYCVDAVNPQEYEDIVMISSTNGSIWLNGSLDADNSTFGTLVKVRVASYLMEDDCPGKALDEDLARNEALVVLTIEDENDNEPIFVDSADTPFSATILLGYPVDQTLQRAKGEVITLMATDADVMSIITYELRSSDSDSGNFVVDPTSGAVHLLSTSSVLTESTYNIVVGASDGDTTATTELLILALDLDSIFTIDMTVADPEDIDMSLAELSKEAGTTIRQVYSQVVSGPGEPDGILTKRKRAGRTGEESDRIWTKEKRSGRTGRAGDEWSLQVHIYAIDDIDFLTLQELNDKLSKVNQSATTFTERSEFSSNGNGGGGGGSTDNTGYKVAVGILGAFVGLVIIAAVLFGGRKVKKDRRYMRFSNDKKTSQVDQDFTDKNETFASIFVDKYSTVTSTNRSKVSQTSSTRFPPVNNDTFSIPVSNDRMVSSVPTISVTNTDDTSNNKSFEVDTKVDSGTGNYNLALYSGQINEGYSNDSTAVDVLDTKLENDGDNDSRSYSKEDRRDTKTESVSDSYKGFGIEEQNSGGDKGENFLNGWRKEENKTDEIPGGDYVFKWKEEDEATNIPELDINEEDSAYNREDYITDIEEYIPDVLVKLEEKRSSLEVEAIAEVHHVGDNMENNTENKPFEDDVTDTESEAKSVAFKVLVDTNDFEEEGRTAF